ncbi:MAG TPA: D-glycero-beta-D-manno-heptose 1-phosphate adenylyltransferase [Negativicutes bacterium]|nr:D-glycero-beta-D-manno-heptose 1-phosphate adenylyltransferase [Negativicutes bacterium]
MITREWADLRQAVTKAKTEGKVVVFTNGCFDILHAGHVRYLTEAKKIGDVLVIGLNSDESVRKLKGAGRPVNSAADRAEVLAGLRAVDHVIVFAEDTAEELVRQLQPDVYVKGGDYSLDRLPESEIVAAYGGRTVLVPMVEGRSTSNVIQKLRRYETEPGIEGKGNL